MLKEKKPVFLIYDKDKAARFNELLSENLNIETELENYGPNKRISVSPEDYQNSLEEGFNISELNKWNMSWINSYGEPRPVGYISVMYCNLPKTREVSSSCELLKLPNCPIDIKEYIEKLKLFIGRRSIKIKYINSDNAIEFLVKGSFEDYELIKQQCEGFDYVTKNSPFVKTTFLEKDGTLIKNEIEEEKEESNLKSYFNESMFVDGLLRPKESNIAPKTDNKEDFTTGYKYSCSGYGVRDFDINYVSNYALEESIEGTFLVDEEKDYSYYWNNEKGKQTYCESKMPFTMLDNGSFESKIIIRNGVAIEVRTNINIIRNIVGYNFDGKSVRDGLFPGLPHEDCRGNFEINEYYKTIADRTRLLHYCESSDFFEVYELPNGWTAKDGISNLGSPKVFDDVDFDKKDKDLEEINIILSSRTTNKGKTFVKKIDNSK